MSPAAGTSQPERPGFTHRGVVEGFYGTPWSHEDRLFVIERIGAWGMNRYVYAPKDDPLHRERWREPYPTNTQRQFRELVQHGERAGVQVGFALSPGLSIHYASRSDREALRAKLLAFRELGARFITIALDDVPSTLVHEDDRRAFEDLASAHLALAAEAQEAIGGEATLWVVPTDYLGVGGSDYLEALGVGLDREIEIGWTGRTVLSPTITAQEASQRSALLRRPLLLWDNTPAADGPMRNMLHLNPYLGRGADLAGSLSGALLNPMQHARASGVTLRSAACFLEDPAGYDPERAFAEATAALGAGAPAAFDLFARAHRFSPLSPRDRDAELEAGFDDLREATGSGRDPTRALERLREAIAARTEVADSLRRNLADRRLAAEIEPWIESHACETRRIAAALDFLSAFFRSGLAKDRVYAFFTLEAKLSREPLPAKSSYGPRRVLYPQLASMRDEQMRLAGDPTLMRNRCLADAFVALAEDLALAELG